MCTVAWVVSQSGLKAFIVIITDHDDGYSTGCNPALSNKSILRSIGCILFKIIIKGVLTYLLNSSSVQYDMLVPEMARLGALSTATLPRFAAARGSAAVAVHVMMKWLKTCLRFVYVRLFCQCMVLAVVSLLKIIQARTPLAHPSHTIRHTNDNATPDQLHDTWQSRR